MSVTHKKFNFTNNNSGIELDTTSEKVCVTVVKFKKHVAGASIFI